MNLVWKLLRRHISVPQFAGFFFANLFGMLIVLLGFQFYNDVLPVFTAGDSFMKADYLIVSKRIGMAGTLSGRNNTFNASDIDDLQAQSFVKRLGKFTSTEYKVDASMGVNGQPILNSEIFFESVPDGFVDVPLTAWKYEAGSKEVPIILPRTYINMYNFGFAQSRSLPKISEGLMGMIDVNIFIHGNGHEDRFKGRVIGFSNRLNTILVPQAFMDWSNGYYAPGNAMASTRLIMEVSNPADEHITKYLDAKGYEVESDKLNAEKTTYFLRMVVSLVMAVGLVISLLSFYILMLSIYLLARVSLPYALVTVTLNVSVLLLSLVLLSFIRSYYMRIIEALFPQIEDGSILPAALVGAVLFVVVTLINQFVIRRKVMRIWYRKD